MEYINNWKRNKRLKRLFNGQEGHKRLYDCLIKQENVQPLEELIQEHVNEKHSSCDQHKVFKDAKMTDKQLLGIFREVKPKVSEFLGVSGIKDPVVHYGDNHTWSAMPPDYPYLAIGAVITGINIAIKNYFGAAIIFPFHVAIYLRSNQRFNEYNKINSHYFPKGRFLNVAPSPQHEIPLIIAHEYAHHISHKTLPFVNRIFLEGLARGVERHISQEYYSNTHNFCFKCPNIKNEIGDMINSYELLCAELDLKRSPHIPIVMVQSVSADKEGIIMALSRKEVTPYPHSIGTSLFYLKEKKYGKQFYKEVLKNPEIVLE